MKNQDDDMTVEIVYRGEIGSYNDILNNPEFYTKQEFAKACEWAYGNSETSSYSASKCH